MSIAEHVLVLTTRYRIFKRVRKKLEYAPREELEQIIQLVIEYLRELERN